MDLSQVARELGNQLGRDVNENLASQIVGLAKRFTSSGTFVSASKIFGSFDEDYLVELFNRVKTTDNEGDNEPSTDTIKRESVEPVASTIKSESVEPVVKSEPNDPSVDRLSSEARKRLQQIRINRQLKRDAPEEPEIKPRFKKRGIKKEEDDSKPFIKREERKMFEDNVEQYDKDTEDALDRDWYAADEIGHAAGDELHNPFYDQFSYEPEQEEQMEKKVQKRVSTRAIQRQKESELWEQNRMRTSGVARSAGLDEMDEDEESRVHVFLHHLTPPFLDGRQVFTRQKDPISAVRDPDGDLAKFSRSGSLLVRERRKKREREKQAREAASMAGTTLGNVLGVKPETSDEVEEEENSFSSKFSKHEASEVVRRPKLTLKEQREQLPAFAVRQEILEVIRNNQVVVVIGETGSGKTTQLTQFLYEDGYGSRGLIGCTQPRRVAAMSVARRVSEEMGVKLGKEVGYTIRFEDVTSDATRIKYLTDGILLRESLADPDLEKYSCIIMDEAHERALNTDVLMGLFKKVLTRRRDLKLIVTSATMNAEKFSRFFGNAPDFTIPGRTFPVKVIHRTAPVEDYVDAAVRQVLQIHVQSGPGDILVFMTGQEDIETTCEVIEERLALLDKPEPLMVLPIYSQMPADLQAKIFDPAPKGTRKVIVATNIAETSLTVDGIIYVVDSGYSKLKVYNPKMGMDSLQITPISRANAGQRSGRAGRTAPGVAYRLYTERAEIEEMYVQTIPEVQRTNLSNTLLLIKSLGVDDLLQFDFMDPPPKDTMTSSLYDLWALGALDNAGRLTPLGHKMSSVPMDPSLAKLLIMSIEYGCSEEVVTIVSMLSVPSVFYRPKERQDESDAAREKFFVPESDHLTLLHVFHQWKVNRYSDAWCARHFLHPKALHRAKEVRDQLVSIFQSSLKAPLSSAKGDWDVIRKCICSGYFHQAAKVKGMGQYVNLRTNVATQLHPTSALYGLGVLPAFVVYHELVLTSKQYMSTVTSIDPRWLVEFGAMFFSIKEKGYHGGQEREYSNRDKLASQIEQDRLALLSKDQTENAPKIQPAKKKKTPVVIQSRKKKRGI